LVGALGHRDRLAFHSFPAALELRLWSRAGREGAANVSGYFKPVVLALAAAAFVGAVFAVAAGFDAVLSGAIDSADGLTIALHAARSGAQKAILFAALLVPAAVAFVRLRRALVSPPPSPIPPAPGAAPPGDPQGPQDGPPPP
jgi:hypothetical protein